MIQHSQLMQDALKTKRDNNHSQLLRGFKRDKYLLLLILPGMLYFLIFKYIPMGGILIAFKDFSIIRGILGSPWAGPDGLENFRRILNSRDFGSVMVNTITISLLKLLINFPIPIILSLLLNELKNKRFKKGVQTIIYLPHFISWVVIAAILRSILSPTYGIMGQLYELFNMQPINLFASARHIRSLVILTDIWKEAGWGTIIYLAAISTVNPELHESAIIDGAGRFRRMLHITLPCISGVVVTMIILRVGNLLHVGFDQIWVMQNDLTRPVIEIFDTFVYRRGIEMAQYSYAATVGLFNAVVSLILILLANTVAKAIGEEGLY